METENQEVEFFRAIGAKGGARTKARYGLKHFANIGKKGGATVAAKGRDYFVELGRKGGLAPRKTNDGAAN